MEEAFSPAGRNWYLRQRGRGLFVFLRISRTAYRPEWKISFNCMRLYSKNKDGGEKRFPV